MRVLSIVIAVIGAALAIYLTLPRHEPDGQEFSDSTVSAPLTQPRMKADTANEAETERAIRAAEPLERIQTSTVEVETETPLRQVQLLPRLPGFAAYGLRDDHPAFALAEEPRDPAWAVSMETQVMAGIQSALNRIDRSATLMEVECRTTLCGVLIVLADSQDSSSDDTLPYRALSSEFRRNHNLDPIGAVGGVMQEQGGPEYWSVFLAESENY